MYDLYDDLTGRGYGYYQADKKRIAVKRLSDKIEAAVKKEVDRQAQAIIDKTIDELQIYFDSHTLQI